MAVDISMRDLRNHTNSVLDALRSGDEVFLTSRGVRVATITPIESKWSAKLDEWLADLPTSDTGMIEFLEADNEASIELEEAERGR